MSLPGDRLDVLAAGREPDRRRRAATAVLVVLLLVAGTAGWLVDQRSRQGESAAVSRCAQRASAQVDRVMSPVSTMAEYVRPAVAMSSSPTTEGLYGMVATAAAAATGGLQQARAGCAALTVHRWHSPQRAALAAQLSYLDAQSAFLRDTAADGRTYFQDRSRISALRARATAALAAARPARVP